MKEKPMHERLRDIAWEYAGLFMALETEDKSWIGRDEEARKIMKERRERRLKDNET
jgi:hypothetical protein